MSHKLSNYLRTYRKRAGFSQDEIAFLLGVHSGAKVCRYERFSRKPSLRTVFAYEVIFQTPARELFAGVYQKVERTVTARAALLSRKLHVSKPEGLPARKLESLKAIASGEAVAKP
jgi:transcriptional regulator with XRE-family HTH domain